MKARLAAGGEKRANRPSGYQLAEGAFGADNGGSIPDNLIVAGTESNSTYIRACKEHGIPVHPARFPASVPEHFVRLLTREGDVVYDPCGGSLKTGEVAEKLGRRWISSELNLEYLLGARYRFAGAA